MNLKEGKIMLEKINRLYDSMVLDSKIDQFEQELMLSYIKKLYVAFSDNGEAMNLVSQNKAAEPPMERRVVEAPKPEPTVIKRVVVEQPRVIVPPPAPKPVSDPEELEMIEEVAAEVVAPAPKPTPTPAPKPVSPPTPPVVKTAPVDEAIADLFDDVEGKELSDRLGSLPIHDLNKAMGLNEKILTVNELFDKDQQAFTTSMHLMNTMGNFEEAKAHLIELAQKYDWVDKEKKAKVLIKLVRRRYK